MHLKAMSASTWIFSGKEKQQGPLPMFRKRFAGNSAASAHLWVTALGVYEATLNGQRVGDFILAPGYTHYPARVQAQRYDITPLMKEDNELVITLGRGWYGSRMMVSPHEGDVPLALRACVFLDDKLLGSDGSWEWADSGTLDGSLYDGEAVDLRDAPRAWHKALPFDGDKPAIVVQDGPPIVECDRLLPVKTLITPKGERVVDFGQNFSGYPEIRMFGIAGQEVVLHHAEVLDQAGNFYTENLRAAKQEYRAILRDGENILKPRFTFYGFRYLRLTQFPGEGFPASITGIAIHSQMEQVGQFTCGHPLVNQLHHNIIWGQKSNFVDVPTDCPQRDERLGWTGDAQAFIRAACYNFDTLAFYKKWLRDLALCQYPGGGVPNFVPSQMTEEQRCKPEPRGDEVSSAWADAATICPWQLYLSYSDELVLRDQFDSMKRWVDYVRQTGDAEELWDTGFHFGDWLAQDGEGVAEGGARGKTDVYLIATAMFANSTDLLVRAGRVLGKDMAEYEALHQGIVKAFRKRFMPGGVFLDPTQTACVLALQFGLAEDPQRTVNTLADLIKQAGTKLQTGFVGTPYLLHVLSDHGHQNLAYDLLLQEDCPSWLFSVKQGATTIWERWDGIRSDGTLNNPGMNSFNHYAFGAVGDWLFGKAAGIEPLEEFPGYQKVRIAPLTDKRLDFVRASLKTPHGTVRSAWAYGVDSLRYEITIPKGMTAQVVLPHHTGEYGEGTWHF